jgi:hypothetical protein
MRISSVVTLSEYAVEQFVAGSIPDGVIEIFHWYNHSGRIMAMGSTQSLAEMSIRLYLRVKYGWWVGLTTLPASCGDCLEILGTSAFWSRTGQSRPVMGQPYLSYVLTFPQTRCLYRYNSVVLSSHFTQYLFHLVLAQLKWKQDTVNTTKFIIQIIRTWATCFDSISKPSSGLCSSLNLKTERCAMSDGIPSTVRTEN